MWCLRTASGDAIPQANPLALSAFVGIGYEIPLGIRFNSGQSSLAIAPEVFAHLGMNPVVQGWEWNLHQLRAGVSLLYRHDDIRERLEERRNVDTIEIEKKYLRIPFMVGISRFTRDTAMITENGRRTRLISEVLLRTDTIFVTKKPRMQVAVRAVGVDENGVELPMVQLRIEEFFSQRTVPLLTYMFFEENSDELSLRYRPLTAAASSEFEIDQMNRWATLDIYHNLLNIIGRRMRDYPEAVLTLTGTNADMEGESGNTDLSARRAERLRQYLRTVWKVPENRIVVKARNLSEQPSLPKTEPDKRDENRRVEITCTVRQVLDPVVVNDTIRVSNPPVVRFLPSAKTDRAVHDWRLPVVASGEEVNMFGSQINDTLANDDGSPTYTTPVMPQRVDWRLTDRDDSLLANSDELLYTLTARDDAGKSGFAAGSLPVQRVRVRNRRFEQFSLILFGFNKSEITERNQHIISLIQARLKRQSNLAIAGYTDRTGDAAYNKQLSTQRAVELARVLGEPASKARGYGEDVLLYDNSTPEGRFYCRSVNANIETFNE
jgi:outer membrane protein OmpA-like peptidoglycan-associated protein